MSSKGAATLAIIRDAGSGAVTQAELGKASEGSTASSSWLDVLTTVVPTGVIAGYSAILAALLGAIPKPSPEDPAPNQFLGWRLALWGVFIGISLLLAWNSYRTQAKQQEKKRAIPMELVVSAAAFAFWGLASPGTWLTELPGFENPALKPVATIAVAVVATLILGVFSNQMSKKLTKQDSTTPDSVTPDSVTPDSVTPGALPPMAPVGPN